MQADIFSPLVPSMIALARARADMFVLSHDDFETYYLTFTGTANTIVEFGLQVHMNIANGVLRKMAEKIAKVHNGFNEVQVDVRYLAAFLPYDNIVKLLNDLKSQECPHLRYVLSRIEFQCDDYSCIDHIKQVKNLKSFDDMTKFAGAAAFLNKKYNTRIGKR